MTIVLREKLMVHCIVDDPPTDIMYDLVKWGKKYGIYLSLIVRNIAHTI